MCSGGGGEKRSADDENGVYFRIFLQQAACETCGSREVKQLIEPGGSEPRLLRVADAGLGSAENVGGS